MIPKMNLFQLICGFVQINDAYIAAANPNERNVQNDIMFIRDGWVRAVLKFGSSGPVQKTR